MEKHTPRRNRVEITKIDRDRGWCWYNGKKYPVPPSQYLYIAVMPEFGVQ